MATHPPCLIALGRLNRMATLIPSLGTCVSRMTPGERRLAERLEQKLDDDDLVWYDVPVGPKQAHPDFVVLHPRRGLLILETKHWKLDTIKSATRQAWEIIPDGQIRVVINPLAQARHCAIQVVNALERDAQLVHSTGVHQGKLAFPWGHGVVFTQITRQQFDAAGLGDAIAPQLAICSDEMPQNVDAEEFQQRLWDMFPHSFGGVMSLPQLDRVRWIMFPEVRVTQGALFDDSDLNAELPDLMRVMDLQQEQLARSLGDGHRVIHGVAGSGKTMILGCRAEHLAKAAVQTKPILVLCYNKALAEMLESVMAAKGLADKVHVRNFHKWCRLSAPTVRVAVHRPEPGRARGAVQCSASRQDRRGAARGAGQGGLKADGAGLAPSAGEAPTKSSPGGAARRRSAQRCPTRPSCRSGCR